MKANHQGLEPPQVLIVPVLEGFGDQDGHLWYCRELLLELLVTQKQKFIRKIQCCVLYA